MKLISLQLCNFRQFYGVTPAIEFARDEKNTTIIYGNNGAGKTSLLNAFTWVLYEKFTAAFASPELLINKRAIVEAKIAVGVECWVEIQFERDRKLYQIKRKCFATKNENNTTSYSPTKLFMLIAGDDGRWYPPLEPAGEIIESILPESLHQYFFFDGERIDGFFRAGKNNNIAEDTKELLGVKVLDRAIEHLKNAKRSLQEELQALGDSKTKQLLQQQIELDREREQLTDKISISTKEIEQLEIQKRNFSSQLLNSIGADKLQEIKEKTRDREQIIRQNLIKTKSEFRKNFSQSGYLVFLPEIIDRFQKILENKRNSGQLISGIRPEFIAQLLNKETCICGTSLHSQTEAYRNIMAWLEKIELKNVEETAINLETNCDRDLAQIENLWQQIDRQQSEIDRQYRDLSNCEGEITKINKQLKNYPDRDIQKLHDNIEAIENRIKSLILEQGMTRQQQEINFAKSEEISQQIAKHKITEVKQKLARRRINATQDSITRLIEVRNRLETQFRFSLEQKVRQIFNFISFTPYQPKLSPNYELTLVENTAGIETPVAASTGENQILSLSFIGGIIDRVREWSQRNSLMGPDSSTFPIVMDSPFGSLDRIYRRQVAKAIPQLARQLIILVTKTQWRGEVETEIADRIDREYVLTYYSPKQDCEEDWLQLERGNYPLVRSSSNQFEYTEIAIVQKASNN